MTRYKLINPFSDYEGVENGFPVYWSPEIFYCVDPVKEDT
jgi:hypothetical protein